MTLLRIPDKQNLQTHGCGGLWTRRSVSASQEVKPFGLWCLGKGSLFIVKVVGNAYILCGAKCCYSLLKEPVHIPTTLLYSIKQGLANLVEQVIPEQLTGPQLVKKFPAFYGTRKFTTEFTVICPYPEPEQSTPCLPTQLCWRSILILFSCLRLGLPNSLSLSLSLRSLHQKPVRTSPVSIHATCLADLILLGLITWIMFDEVYRA